MFVRIVFLIGMLIVLVACDTEHDLECETTTRPSSFGTTPTTSRTTCDFND